MDTRRLATASLLILLACDPGLPTGPPERLEDASLSLDLLSAIPAPAPQLVSASFLGGPGDQRGWTISADSGVLFVGGNNGPRGLLARYTIASTVPDWSLSGPANSSFFGLGILGSTIFVAGEAQPPTCGASDGVGGTEGKSVLAWYTSAGAFLSCRSQNFFTYRGYEWFWNATAARDGSPALYATGTGEEIGWGGGRTILAGFDPSGALLWKRKYATDFAGNPIAGTYTQIGSSGNDLFWQNGYLYIAGWDRDGHRQNIHGRAMLLKYDAASQLPDPNPGGTGAQVLVPVWARVEQVGSRFQGVTGLGGSIYAVGAAWPTVSGTDTDLDRADFLAVRYDENGNLLWSTTWGGADKDWLTGVTTVHGRLFAVGYTRSGTAGGSDAVLVEIDPASGTVLSTVPFGGTRDDLAQDVATDGADLFVVGESRSFTEGGNGAGQNDLMLLHYHVEPPVIEVAVDVKPGSDVNPVNLGAQGRLPVAVLTTDDFDAGEVDPAAVTLGDDDGDDTPVAAQKKGRLMVSLEDVDGDGDVDLMLYFEIQALVANGDLSAATTRLCLNGRTLEGRAVHGCDAVGTVR